MPTSGLSPFTRHLRSLALLQDGAGLDDRQLLEWFLIHREEAAFQALVRRHGPLVLSVCRRILRDPHDAEDAFQATFLVFIRKAASIRNREIVSRWLYRVAARTARKMTAMRAKRRRKEQQASRERHQVGGARRQVILRRHQVSGGRHQVSGGYEPPGEWETGSLERPDWEPILDEELNALPEKYHHPILLCDLQGKTQK